MKVGEKTNIIKIKRKKNKEKHEEKTKKVNSRIQKQKRIKPTLNQNKQSVNKQGNKFESKQQVESNH